MDTKKTPLVLALAFALPLAAATPGSRTGSFAPGERVTPPDVHAPAADSRTMVKSVMPLGGRVAVDIPATGSGSLLVLAIPTGAGGALQSALESPTGRRLPQAQTQSDDLRRFAVASEELGLDLPIGAAEVAEVLHVEKAEAGAYHLSAATPSGVALVTIVAAEPDSPLVLRTWAGPLSRHEGEPIVLHAEVSDGGAPVAGARVVARLAPEGGIAGPEIALYDDGRHGDGAASDGVYAATVDDLQLPSGFVTARFEAEGRGAGGALFSRTGSGGLMNEPALGRLARVSAAFVGNGETRRLRVTADAEVREAGDYRLDAIVSGAAAEDGSRAGIAWGERTLALEKGATRIFVDIPAEKAGDVHVDVRLLGLTTTGVVGRVEVDAAR